MHLSRRWWHDMRIVADLLPARRFPGAVHRPWTRVHHDCRGWIGHQRLRSSRSMSGSTSAHAPDAPAGGADAAGGGTSAWHETAAHLPGPAGCLVPVPPSHHGHDLARWPLRNAITLGALEGAVPSARAHVRQLLCEWARAELGQDV